MKIIGFVLLIITTINADLSPECIAGPPVAKNPMECCKTPTLLSEAIFINCSIEQESKMHALEVNATASLSVPPPPLNLPPRGCCISECVFNATGILVNGTVDKANSTKQLLSAINATSVWVPIVTAALDNCFTQAMAKDADFKAVMALPPQYPGEKICNPISGFLIGCVYSHLFRNCPPTKWTEDADCARLKTHLEKCPLPFPMKKQM